MNNEVKKNNYLKIGIWFLAISLFLILVIFLTVKYVRYHTPERIQSSVQPIIEKKEANIDSLMKIINQAITSLGSAKQSIIIDRGTFQQGYANALQTAPDTCRYYINAIYRNCARLDSSNQRVIQKQDTALGNYAKAMGESADVIALQKFQMNQFRDTIQEDRAEIKTLKKKLLRAKVGGWVKSAGSFIIGVASGRASSKIIP